MRLLRFAKECGKRLIVAVESDRIAGINAHVHENLRLENIKSNSLIDEAFISDESIAETTDSRTAINWVEIRPARPQ